MKKMLMMMVMAFALLVSASVSAAGTDGNDVVRPQVYDPGY
ncbi:hypothetical protein [Brevibacillus marinus]|nr:hypothetical protein [Brevibacillus marinus]